MPPKRKGRSRSSSRSRPQSADQPEIEQEEEKKDPIHQEEDQEEEEEPPQDVPLQAAQVAAGAMPQVAFAPPPPAVVFAPLQAGLPPEQEQAPGAPPAFQGMAARQRAPYIYHVPTEKISTLTKNIVKLAHGNFAAWNKAIDEIAYYRKWDKMSVVQALKHRTN